MNPFPIASRGITKACDMQQGILPWKSLVKDAKVPGKEGQLPRVGSFDSCCLYCNISSGG
ncbi:conserved hypothetical protein [Ricinus communis]|uniref:Uncharacterized protein n=1 Tax=Ricinus communis TaxID=3988 RepID=B9S7L5_RICCO|nr:conserved hypothetical protein [Ricinus communis]